MFLLWPNCFQPKSLFLGFLGISAWKDERVWAFYVVGFRFQWVHLPPSPLPFVARSSPFSPGCHSQNFGAVQSGQEAFPWEPCCQHPARTGPRYLPPLPLLSDPRTKELGACRLVGCLSRARPSLAQMLSKQECQPHYSVFQ